MSSWVVGFDLSKRWDTGRPTKAERVIYHPPKNNKIRVENERDLSPLYVL
jgi:hypothetical protein